MKTFGQKENKTTSTYPAELQRVERGARQGKKLRKHPADRTSAAARARQRP